MKGILGKKVGMTQIFGDHGVVTPVTVIEAGPETVKIDANHALAGVELNFDVEVVGVRAAEQVEIDHGHVHGPGGHDH